MLVLALSLAAVVTVDAPVTAVTVFSDRARVTRTAHVSLGTTDRVELPLLPDSVDPASIRVDASSAEIKRIDIAHVASDEFPADEARALLAEMDKLDDKIAKTRAERDAPQALLATVRGLSPSLPRDEPLKAPVRLSSAGWGASFSFVDSWMDRLQAKVREQNDKLFDLDKQRAELVAKATILGGAVQRSGHRVTVLLSGKGTAKVTLTYMAANARWAPSYDIQLLSDQKKAQVAFAGLVSQETGEDWNDAQLTLSTAVPATATVFPKLRTWKIGEKERFIPTPVPVAESVRPPPRAVPPIVDERDTDYLRERLARAVSRGPAGQPATEDGRADEAKKDANEYSARLSQLEQRRRELEERVSRSKSRMTEMKEEAAGEAEGDSAPMSPPPEPAPAMAMPESVSTRSYGRGAPAKSASSYAASTPQVPADQVGIAPPPGYQPPYYGPELPVSLAGGYDLSFKALRNETIKTGKEARRVALLSQAWPVEVERRVFPALAPEAYVTAELKNPSPTALPGGNANLSVGDDPAGTARINVVAPGEKFVLPLGLDRAIKPVRNVKLVQQEKGVFSKDDYGEYTVTIEIANPYRAPLSMRVIDQLPITDAKDLEIKAMQMDPAPAEQDKLKGSLEWRITVPASGKSVIRFGYSIRRPKGWRLHQ